MPYDPKDFDASSVKLDRFMKAATDQIGDKYQFGAETSFDDPNPTAFDSSELVEWAAHQAGMHDMPDGSWNQYRYLHEQGATVSVDEALHTKGALVFGFSSDPLESSDRPARAYVGISLGNGKVLDVSERGGEVREMDPGDFYTYAAKIPEFHAVDDSQPTVDYPGGIGPSHDDTPADPNPPARSVGPDGRVLHEDLPGPDDAPADPQVCYPEDDAPEANVCYPDDDAAPTSTNDSGFETTDPSAYVTDEPVDSFAYASTSPEPSFDVGFDDSGFDVA
jgi:hypothetical protein